MGLIARIFNWLKTSSLSSSDDDQDLTRPIDIPQAIKDLRLLEEARAMGSAGQPAASATTPSGPEVVVLDLVERKRQEFVKQGFRRISLLNESLALNDITRNVNAALDADKEFGQKAGTLLTAKEATLKATGDAAKASNDELLKFKAENRLQREAKYPLGLNKGIKWVYLLLAVIGEGFANAYFFAQGLDSGLIGGAIMAGTTAAINVGIALFLGFFAMRYRLHVVPAKRVAGWVGCAVALAWLLIAGLGIGHIRDALTAEAAEPFSIALHHLKENPFGLADMRSWGLFLISFVAGCFAIYEAHQLDDCYPGFGEATRAALASADIYEREIAEVREDLEALKEEYLTRLEEVALSSQTSLALYASTIDAKKTASSKLDGNLAGTSVALQALLSTFRTENTLCRNSAPRPAYFDEILPLQDLELPDFGTAQDSLKLAEQREKLDQLISQTQELTAKIQNAFNQKFDQLQPLTNQFSQEA